MCLILKDSYTKWIEVIVINSTTSHATIMALRSVISCLGLPKLLVSENGTPFVSSEFNEFCELNGIRHLISSHYYPESNGTAENTAAIRKMGMGKLINDK